jgi:hypothetical protein
VIPPILQLPATLTLEQAVAEGVAAISRAGMRRHERNLHPILAVAP